MMSVSGQEHGVATRHPEWPERVSVPLSLTPAGPWCHPEVCRGNPDLKPSGTEWEQEPEAKLGSESCPGQKWVVQGRECSAAADMAQLRAHHTDPWAVGDNEGPWEQVQQPELWQEGRLGWAGVCEADASCGHGVTGRPWLASPAFPPRALGFGWAVIPWLRNISSTHVLPTWVLHGKAMSSCGCTPSDVLQACPSGLLAVQHMSSVTLISPRKKEVEAIRSRHRGLDYICRAELLHSNGWSTDLTESSRCWPAPRQVCQWLPN